jgi:hypothetical protein
MRRLSAICAGFLILFSVSGVAASTDTDEGTADSTSSPGLVYGYGIKISRPYEFTESEDGKTLYLNGLIYAGPGDKEPPPVTVADEILAQHELNVRALEEARKGTTDYGRLARMASAYIHSPLVESVRKDSHSVYVKWVSSPHEMRFFLMPLSGLETTAFDRAAFWEQLEASFWRTVNSGGMVVFGEKYHIFVPDSGVQKTLEQIELVRRGTSREGLDTRGTPLRNQRFLDDLYGETDAVDGE